MTLFNDKNGLNGIGPFGNFLARNFSFKAVCLGTLLGFSLFYVRTEGKLQIGIFFFLLRLEHGGEVYNDMANIMNFCTCFALSYLVFFLSWDVVAVSIG